MKCSPKKTKEIQCLWIRSELRYGEKKIKMVRLWAAHRANGNLGWSFLYVTWILYPQRFFDYLFILNLSERRQLFFNSLLQQLARIVAWFFLAVIHSLIITFTFNNEELSKLKVIQRVDIYWPIWRHYVSIAIWLKHGRTRMQQSLNRIAVYSAV